MPELLLEKPHGRNEPLISRRMWKHVVVQGLYQLFWLFLIIYGAPMQLPAFAVRCPGPTSLIRVSSTESFLKYTSRDLPKHLMYGICPGTDARHGCPEAAHAPSAPAFVASMACWPLGFRV